MPLYEYGCPACDREWEEHIPLARFAESRRLPCSCGALANRMISRVLLQGLTTPGHSAWNPDGMFGGSAARGSSVVEDMQKRIDAGTVPKGADRNLALSYVREHQMATELGLTAEAQMYERGIAKIAAETDRKRAKQPRRFRVGKRMAVATTQDRQVTRNGRTSHTRVLDVRPA